MSADLDNLLNGFDEAPPARIVETSGGSRIEITWIASVNTLTIRVVAGEDGDLLLAGELESIDDIEVTLTGGAAEAFWESLQQRPPPDNPFSGPDWSPKPGGEGSGG